MQQSTDAQLDDRVAGKNDKTVPGTVMAILSTELTSSAFKKNKKQKYAKHSSSSNSGDIEPSSDVLENSAMLKNNQTQALMSNAMVPLQFVGNHTGLPLNPAQTVMDSNGQQFFMVPVNPMPQMLQSGGNVLNANTPSFSGGRGGGGRSGRNSGQMRGRSDSRFRRNFTKHSGIFDA